MGYIVDKAASVMCPHAATASLLATNVRVTLGGQPIIVVTDTYTISGCPFQVPIGTGTKPQPCVTGKWLSPATRVKADGQPVVLSISSGLVQSAEQIPAGPPTITVTQMRVKGM